MKGTKSVIRGGNFSPVLTVEEVRERQSRRARLDLGVLNPAEGSGVM